MSKSPNQDAPRPAAVERRVRRLNPRALILLIVALAVGVPAFFGVLALQNNRRRDGLLREARLQVEQGQVDQALRFVGEYLRLDPDDPEAAALRAELLADTARTPGNVDEAIRACQRALRLGLRGEALQRTRRSLIRLYLETERFRASNDVEYTAAQQYADQQIAEAEAAGGAEAEDHLLRGRVLEGSARRAAGQAAEDRLAEAVEAYERAHRLAPGDAEAAERLADLRRRLGDNGRAEEVLDALVRADGGSPEAHLVRYRHYSRHGQAGRASDALRAAIERAPEDPEARLAAVREALRDGDLAEARGHLEALPEADRDTVRARFLAGLIELQAGDQDGAVGHWRRGLVLSNGTDADLTWWLAYILLQSGRVDEAAPLIDQFYRLVGRDEETPEHRLLEALRLLKVGQPARALAGEGDGPDLEVARLQIVDTLKPQANFVLGQCYEETSNRDRALEAYREAAGLSPSWAAPRLAIVRLLGDRPDEAVRELERALRDNPDDPTLLLEVAERTWREELRRPEAERSWDRAEALLDRAEAAAPGSPRVALARANYLSGTGRLDRAVELLGRRLEEPAVRRSAEAWAAYATGLARSDRPEEAAEALRQATAGDAAGDRASLRILRARLLTGLGRGREARAELVADLDRLPEAERARIYRARADLHLAQGDAGAAAEDLRRAAGLDPADPAPRLLLLDLALAAGDTGAVREHVRALQDGFGGPEGLYGRVGEVHRLLLEARQAEGDDREARLEEAGRIVAQIRRDAPALPAGHLLRGLLLEQRGEVDGAIEAYEQVVRESRSRPAAARLSALLRGRGRPEDLERLGRLAAELGEPGDASRYLAEAERSAGDREQARRLAAEFLEGNPESLEAHVWAARFLKALGSPEEAEQALRDLTRRRPSELGPWLALLAYQVQDGRAEQALATIEQIERNAEIDRPEFILAQCYRMAGRADRAGELFREALEKWPGEALVQRVAAAFFKQAGLDDEAEATVRAAMEADPDAPWAARELALILSARRGDDDAAAEARRLVGPEGPLGESPEDRLARAVVLGRLAGAGGRGEAIRLLEGLVADVPAAEPVAVTARGLLVELLLDDGRPGEASRRAGELVDARARPDPTALGMYAEALLADGRPGEADAQVDRLAALIPGDPRIPRLRARIRLADGDRDGAVAALVEAAEALDPGGPQAGQIVELARTLAGLGARDEARGVARRLADYDPAAAWLLAEVLVGDGDPDAALTIVGEAADAGASTDELAPTIERIAAASAAEPTRLEALAGLLERLASGRPEDTDLLRMLALVRHFQGRFEEEVDLYARIDGMDPAEDLYLNNWAWTLSEELGRPAEGLPLIERALERAGPRELGPLLDTKGVILTRLGRLEEAVEALEDSIRSRESGVTYFHLARARSRDGRDGPSREALRKARELGLDPTQLSADERADWDELNRQ